ncbi:MAG TPA: nucleoside 2-deoxyribosyltransferase [Actinomycetota bacterium]|nr:nucleoside 2-deoxyribosyltransferase [Actinomycetota bacterium]
MASRPKIYVASPLGFSAPTRMYYESELLPRIAGAGFEALDPWALPAGASFSDPVDPMVIGNKNERMIQAAAAVLAVLDGADVDSGTAAEIGYAAALGRPVVGYRTDLRQSGEEGAAVNLQVEYFVRATGGRITASLDEALEFLTGLCGQP